MLVSITLNSAIYINYSICNYLIFYVMINYIMRLFHIDGGSCKYIIDLMPSINAIYQLHEEFYPYLKIEFLPYREDEKQGIILQTKTEIIRKPYTFKNKNDIEELRGIIWYYLEKDYNVKSIEFLTNFIPHNPNNVILGWKNKLDSLDKDICCKIILDSLTSNILKHNILHEVYRLSNKDIQTRDICKNVRFSECGDNYPKNTETFNRCIREANWLCNNGYPNNVINKMNSLVKKIKIDLYNDLYNNNLKVNKKKFDEIISAGLFQNIGIRMNNLDINKNNVKNTINQIFTEKNYYLNLIEDFMPNHIDNYKINILFILIIIFVLLFI